MKRASRSRQSVKLPESLRRKVEMYGLAMAAAGISVAGLASAAEGEVVFTPAHQAIPFRGGITLDLNHDGIPDFRLARVLFGLADSIGLIASSLHGNRVLSGTSAGGRGGWVANLPAGYAVGAGSGKFKPGGTFSSKFGPAKDFYNCFIFSGPPSCGGPWDKTQTAYVGFQFVIQGETHYGWARLKVTVQDIDDFNVYLTGYAYETIANKPIVTGKTSGAVESGAKESETSPSLRPASASLGMLSAGASALAMWRMEIQ